MLHYGVPQFEHALCTFMAKKPLFMIGQASARSRISNLTNWLINVFGHCDALILRESVSLDLMKRSNITTAKVEHGVDIAWWSITTQKTSPPAMLFNTGWMLPHKIKRWPLPCVNWHCFDKRRHQSASV
ncbi:polysaccharide pyruvyl transferase family protein [Escherichia coli]